MPILAPVVMARTSGTIQAGKPYVSLNKDCYDTNIIVQPAASASGFF